MSDDIKIANLANPIEPLDSWHVILQHFYGDGESISKAYDSLHDAANAMLEAGGAWLDGESTWYPLGIVQTVFVHPPPGGCD